MKLLAVVAVAGCAEVVAPPIEPPIVPTEEHDPRFVGFWAVEQPFHALYEVTYYRFGGDGSLAALASVPADCSGHLSEHCVTGSVRDCVPDPQTGSCTGATSCVFGDAWSSRGSSTLVVVGACSDAVAREIVIELSADPSSNTSFGGAGGTLVSVGGSPTWSHDNFDWAFRKCESSDLERCAQGPF